MKRGARRDAAWAAVVGVAAAVVGMAYTANWDGRALFWQDMLAPTVLWACGAPPGNPDWYANPQLAAFLSLEQPRFDCASLDLAGMLPPGTPPEPGWDAKNALHPNPHFPGWLQWQQFHGYLLGAVALCFALFGVAWSALTPLYGLLYGVSGAAVFGLLRCVAARPVALLFTALYITSPLQLSYLPHLRDYSKAPFFLVAQWLLALLLYRPRPRRVQALLALAIGATLGAGVGWRQDVLLAVALCALLAGLALPGAWRLTRGRRIVCPALVVSAFLAVGAPILVALAGASNTAHDTLIGLLDYTERRVGVDSPLYDHGDPFLDEYTRAVVASHAACTGGTAPALRHYSRAYDAAAGAYYTALLTTLPADFVTRAWAAVLRLCDELRAPAPAPPGVSAAFTQALFDARAHVADALHLLNRYTAVLALALLAAVSPRRALAAAVAFLVLAGYPSLRFSVRHTFWLEALALALNAWLWQALLAGAHQTWRRWRGHEAPRWWPGTRVAVRRALVAVALLLLAYAVPLGLLRAYQSYRMETVLTAFADAPTVPAHARAAVGAGGQTHGVTLPPKPEALRAPEAWQATLHTWLVLEVPARPGPLPVTLQYASDDPAFDFTRTITLPPDTVPTRLYHPVFTTPHSRLVSVALPPHAPAGLHATWMPPCAVPLPLTVTLPDDWRSLPRHQRLTR